MQCNPGLTAPHPRHHRRRSSSTTSTRCATSRSYADDPAFQDAFATREAAEQGPAGAAGPRPHGASGSTRTRIFDIQVKRIHEYKRQLLNIIEAVALYDQIRSHPERNWMPRVKIFAGKAAPTYHNAKLIIKLANDVARVINSNPTVRSVLQRRVRPELQRQPRRGAGAGRRPLRADLDRRHGGLRHRQHEVRAERRASPSARSTAPTSRSASWSGRRTSSSSA